VDEMDQKFEIVRASDSGALTAEVIRTRAPLRLGETAIAARYVSPDRRPWGTLGKSWLGVPLVSSDKVLGVLGVQHYTQSGIYQESDEEFLMAAAHPVAMVLERDFSRREMKKGRAAMSRAERSEVLDAWTDGVIRRIGSRLDAVAGEAEALTHEERPGPNRVGQAVGEAIDLMRQLIAVSRSRT